MNYKVGSVDLSSLLKARTAFETFRSHLNTDQDKAGVIQAFEFSYELSWKTMKKILAERGVIVNTPRDAFREAGLAGLISDAEVWFDFIRVRNLTVHTYDPAVVDTVLAVVPMFSRALTEFLQKLGVAL